MTENACLVWGLSLPANAVDQVKKVLSGEELADAARFKSDARREQALAGRLLMRLAASCGTETSPRAWRIARGSLDRPLLTGENAPADINISHTEGYVTVARCSTGRVGVDVEPLARAERMWAIRSKFLTDEESESWRSKPDSEQRRDLVARWVLKEACVKAHGGGIGLDLRGITISGAGANLRATGSAGDYALALLCAGEDHLIGVAVSRDMAPAELRDGRELLGQMNDAAANG
ncbi:MAG: 4'-phosphopantetheinyl transferase superfamily protein [Pseudomonadota bacterium]